MENQFCIEDIKQRIMKDSNGVSNYIHVSIEEMDWVVEQAVKTKELEWKYNQLQSSYEEITDKLADIRELFDDSDARAGGHGMEDIVGSPYAVACYAENKIKRLLATKSLLENSLQTYKEDSDLHEKSTHINEFVYEFDVRETGEILCLIKVHGVEHTFGVTEKDARAFLHLFRMNKIGNA